MTIHDILAETDPAGFAIALGDHVAARESTVGFRALTAPEQAIYCVAGLEREVNNGGFHQFFLNATGEHALQTVGALRAIGAAHTATLLERALTVFPDAQPPRDADAREIFVAGLPPDAMQRLQGLDGEFFAYQDDLTGLTRAFVSAHAGAFPT